MERIVQAFQIATSSREARKRGKDLQRAMNFRAKNKDLIIQYAARSLISTDLILKQSMWQHDCNAKRDSLLLGSKIKLNLYLWK
jgi:hypothetical protein